jgi:hypothetical protein
MSFLYILFPPFLLIPASAVIAEQVSTLTPVIDQGKN